MNNVLPLTHITLIKLLYPGLLKLKPKDDVVDIDLQNEFIKEEVKRIEEYYGIIVDPIHIEDLINDIYEKETLEAETLFNDFIIKYKEELSEMKELEQDLEESSLKDIVFRIEELMRLDYKIERIRLKYLYVCDDDDDDDDCGYDDAYYTEGYSQIRKLLNKSSFFNKEKF
jgi:hypothetical protein